MSRSEPVASRSLLLTALALGSVAIAVLLAQQHLGPTMSGTTSKPAAARRATQKLEETEGERAQRDKAGFPAVEAALAGLRLDFRVPVLPALSSLLGRRNPLATAVQPGTDVVWLFDNTAHRGADGAWQASFVAAYFAADSGQDTSQWIATIADAAGLGSMQVPRMEGEETIAARLQPFLDVIRPAKFVAATFPSGRTERLGPSARNGVSTDVRRFSSGGHRDGDAAETVAAPASLAPHGGMLTHFAEPEGWLVVSDIDDTIKVTMTPSPTGILRSTFIDDPVPITGQPDLYTHIAQALRPAWFYLSASPYNLYPFLRPFLHQHYPKGTLLLRDASWMDLGGFLQALTQGTEAYKATQIENIFQALPRRKALCIGDSTQSDPEAYGDIYRKHPGFVKAIFIRKVTGVAEMDDSEKNSPERFEKAFRDVPASVWKVFDEPQELYAHVDALKASS